MLAYVNTCIKKKINANTWFNNWTWKPDNICLTTCVLSFVFESHFPSLEFCRVQIGGKKILQVSFETLCAWFLKCHDRYETFKFAWSGHVRLLLSINSEQLQNRLQWLKSSWMQNWQIDYLLLLLLWNTWIVKKVNKRQSSSNLQSDVTH